MLSQSIGTVLNLNFVSLNCRLESNKEEEEVSVNFGAPDLVRPSSFLLQIDRFFLHTQHADLMIARSARPFGSARPFAERFRFSIVKDNPHHRAAVRH